MAVNAERSVEPPALLPRASSEEWIARIGRLQDALAVCPSDILARCELAMLLEQLEQPEEALLNWNAVLTRDPNSLKAREGVARCRQRTGQPLQSVL
jgi:thioredoxin-like negative regulator of GroEL